MAAVAARFEAVEVMLYMAAVAVRLEVAEVLLYMAAVAVRLEVAEVLLYISDIIDLTPRLHAAGRGSVARTPLAAGGRWTSVVAAGCRTPR